MHINVRVNCVSYTGAVTPHLIRFPVSTLRYLNTEQIYMFKTFWGLVTLGWAVREAPRRTTLLTPYDVKLAVRVYGCSVRAVRGVRGYLSVRGAKSGVRSWSHRAFSFYHTNCGNGRRVIFGVSNINSYSLSSRIQIVFRPKLTTPLSRTCVDQKILCVNFVHF